MGVATPDYIAVERFVLGSSGSRVGDKCEWYCKRHESHYILYGPRLVYVMPLIHLQIYAPLLPNIDLFKSLDIDKREWLEDIKHGDSSSTSFMACVEECISA